MKSLVSVLMPVYNCEKYLVQAIESILNQTYENIELLILDDGSKDASWKKITSFSDTRISYFRFSKNQGNVIALNFLIQKAAGEYITIQDADDWSDLNRIMAQVYFLEEHPDIGLCGTGYRYAQSFDILEEPVELPCSYEEIMKFIEQKRIPPVCCASMMFRRKVYEQVGFFRTYFNRIGSADFDWYYRVLTAFSVANLKSVYYFYRKNPLSFTNTRTTNKYQQFSQDIAFFLYHQRKTSGIDSIETNKLKDIDCYLESYLAPYKEDPSLVLREMVNDQILKKQWLKSFLNIIKAIAINPLSKDNYKILRFWTWKFTGI
jgi:glycosyltransferase involved in cell wall biosynthesis